jgi:hypothetical protein
MKRSTYRILSITLAIAFGAVGIIFLVLTNDLLQFFNTLSAPLGLPAMHAEGARFYVVLAIAYMYCVTMLAILMYRHPETAAYPHLLAQAKFVSAGLSFLFAFVESPLLILLANGLVDGAIGVLATGMARYSEKGLS